MDYSLPRGEPTKFNAEESKACRDCYKANSGCNILKQKLCTVNDFYITGPSEEVSEPKWKIKLPE